MRVLTTPQFDKCVKRLHSNQKKDLDKAVRAIVKQPDIGEQKKGDLSWVRVHKFRMIKQLTLLAYEIKAKDTIVLHIVGSHENFYRDLKQ
ncbi:type II toxin-antitoxin system RelE/ParE family toxin [bacterium]|nr:type II toxin-antitoxin system RelE/ParE family toxin [bacterium]